MFLAIDTSAGTSVALVDAEGGIVAEAATDDTMRHAEAIGPLIAECLVQRAEVTEVVVGMGPGPFTGLRVGIAAARAFAWGRRLPVLPVVSHDAIAFAHFRDHGAARRITVVTDARRREVYWTTYAGSTAEGVPVRSAGPALAAPADLPLTDALRLEPGRVPAAELGRLALAIRSESLEFGPHEPLYLRSPDVTMRATAKRVGQ